MHAGGVGGGIATRARRQTTRGPSAERRRSRGPGGAVAAATTTRSFQPTPASPRTRAQTSGLDGDDALCGGGVVVGALLLLAAYVARRPRPP